MRVHLPFRVRPRRRSASDGSPSSRETTRRTACRSAASGRDKDVGERGPFARRQFVEAADAPARQDHRLERPDRPERHERRRSRRSRRRSARPASAPARDSRMSRRRPCLREIVRLAMRLLVEFVRQAPRRPDLPVRMRVRAAHDLAAILEDLHGADVGQRAEIDGLARPRRRRRARSRRPSMPASVRSWRGEKQMTRQRAGFALRDEQPILDSARPARRAAAQRSRCRRRRCADSPDCARPLARSLPGHR